MRNLQTTATSRQFPSIRWQLIDNAPVAASASTAANSLHQPLGLWASVQATSLT